MLTPSITINVQSMQGLGDNIYQRPYVKALAQQGNVYINTSWPELYADIENVHFVKPTTTLRTQKKHYDSLDIEWAQMPTHPDKAVGFGYGGGLDRTTIPATMRKASGINPPEMDLPQFGFDIGDIPIAFVRPATERKEWLNKARNPNPEYIAKAVDALKDTHHIVSVADIDGTNEWKIGDCYADSRFENGELSLTEMLGLFQAADVIVGGVGWIVPAAIAAKKHAIIIGGGQLGHNHIDRLTNAPMDLSRIHYIAPDNGCYCVNMRHDCNKEIVGFDEWLSSVLSKLKD